MKPRSLSFSLLCIPVFVLILPHLSEAQNTFISFTDHKKDAATTIDPQRKIDYNKDNTILFNFSIPGAFVSKKRIDTTSYRLLNIKGLSKIKKTGAPAVPIRKEIIALPRGAELQLSITSSKFIEYQNFEIHPALAPARDTEGISAPGFKKDDKIYSRDAFFPAEVAHVSKKELLRNTPLFTIQFNPVQYNPVTKVLRVYSSIEVKIEQQGGLPNFDYLKKENSKTFTNLLKRKIANSLNIPDGKTSTFKSPLIESESSAKDYIIITHDEYSTAANNLANWKRQLGYSVEIVSKSSWTTEEVKTEVHNRYDNWNIKPDYLLIMGDHTGDYAVPGEIHQTYDDDNFASDLYYVCMDGVSDHLPDMAKGRISVSSANEAEVVVNKIINYEKTPPNSLDFYTNMLSCAQFQDVENDEAADGYACRRFCHTSEEIRDYLQDEQSYTSTRIYWAESTVTPTNFNNGYYSNGEAIAPELLRSNGFAWDGDQNDIIDEINAGKFLVFHRDHGYVGGSGWAHPRFTTYDIPSLNNGNLQPVIFSMNCHTGEFQLDNCFAEKFLRVENKGAVGVVAAAYFSYSGYNDALSTGMIGAIWSEPGIYANFGSAGTGTNYTIGAGNDIYTMGDVVNQGLFAMNQNYGNNTYSYEIFHYFGDPAMKIWTHNPNSSLITATYSSSVDCEYTTYEITDSEPGAIATLVQNNTLLGKTTIEADGSGTINYTLTQPEDITLTISKHNFLPFTTTLSTECTGFAPLLTCNEAETITETSALLSAEIVNDFGNAVSESGFILGLSSTIDFNSPEIVIFDTNPLVGMGEYSLEIERLTPNTTYYYRAYAINSIDTSLTNTHSFKTNDNWEEVNFVEDFSSLTLPPGWSINDNEGNGQIWQFDNPNNRETNTTTSDNGFAILDSDAYGSGNTQNCDLISPLFDLSDFNEVFVSFDHYFRSFSGSSGSFQYSTDNGETWTEIQSWTSSSNAETASFDFSSTLSGESQVSFKWNYTGTWGFYWIVDDFKLILPEITQMNRVISNHTITNGTFECFDAQEQIVVGGILSPVIIENNASANFIAGQSIRFLPGFHAHSGSNVDAHITTNNTFCDNLPTSILEVHPIPIKNNTPKPATITSIEHQNEKNKLHDIKVYPNPNNGRFNIQLVNFDKNTQIIVFNTTGQVIFKKSIQEQTLIVELTNVNKGIYFVKALGNNKQLDQKIIIK